MAERSGRFMAGSTYTVRMRWPEPGIVSPVRRTALCAPAAATVAVSGNASSAVKGAPVAVGTAAGYLRS